MNTCPVCQKPVDSLRARFVAVRDGKVIAYCSAEHKAQDEAGRTSGAIPVRAATPVAGVPVRLGDGPPRPITPVTGVPVSLPGDAERRAPETGPVITIEPGSGAVRADRTEPRAKHPDEISMAAFWNADKEKGTGPVDKLDKAPAAKVDKATGPVAKLDPATGPIARLAAKDRTAPVARLDARPDPSEVTPARGTAAAQDAADAELADRKPVRRLPRILVAVIVVGGGLLLYHFLTSPKPEPPPPAEPPRAARVEPAEPPPPAITPAAAVAQAEAALRAALSATPRVARLGAEALARTGDPEARALLAAQLGLPAAKDGSTGQPPAAPVETSDIARLDLAYALARGKDDRGVTVLASALASPRAETRDEAARLLALLGDVRAVPHLTDLLAVPQRRLGAAEHLAHLAEPRAVKALDQLRADPKAAADDRARATIALAIAHHGDVAPALRDMLGDAHFNAFAASALAELKDPAARPVLAHQLDSPALRVRAARALRRLDPGLDPVPLLPRLLDLVRTGRDTDQIAAAEAVLLLAGDPAWSERE
jgi:HEAT repeat protein/YHS domain-containing protein